MRAAAPSATNSAPFATNKVPNAIPSFPFLRLLAGRHIHDASNEFDLLMKMGNEPAPPLASMTRGVPRDVCLLVDRALAFDREQRYPEARMMLDDVRALRLGERPRHAVMLAGDTDREALTPFGGQAAEPAVPEEPSTSVMIPLEWSESGLSVDVTIKTTTPAAHVEEPSSFESTLPSPDWRPVKRWARSGQRAAVRQGALDHLVLARDRSEGTVALRTFISPDFFGPMPARRAWPRPEVYRFEQDDGKSGRKDQ